MEKPDQLPVTEKQVLIEKALEDLVTLFEDWSDEVPKEILRGRGEYKVRVNWWSTVTAWLYVIKEKELIEEKGLTTRIEGFLGTYSGRDYWKKGRKRTTKEDIAIANSVLKDVIAHLKRWS